FVADGLDDEVTISASGRVEGTSDDPTVGAAIVGDGQIFNGGSITLATPLVRAGEVQVLFHNHRVSFDPAGGSPDPDPITVFAPTFSQGERSLPAGPARTGFEFVGWHTAADGGGELVD